MLFSLLWNFLRVNADIISIVENFNSFKNFSINKNPTYVNFASLELKSKSLTANNLGLEFIVSRVRCCVNEDFTLVPIET